MVQRINVKPEIIRWARERLDRDAIPDVCSQFNVTYKDTFEMLHELKVRYEWRG